MTLAAKRSIRRAIAVPVIAVLCAVSAVVVWQWRDGTSTAGQGETTCVNGPLRVAAAPEIAPVIETAARTLTPDDGGACRLVEVVAEEPVVTESAAQKPDVWIPSSTAWLRIAEVNGAAFHVRGESLARSPIVLAAPENLTDRYQVDGKPSWTGLTDAVAKRRIPAVTMPDPLRSTVGLLSVHSVHQAMARSTPDSGIAQLQALTLRSRLQNATADPATLLGQIAGRSDASGVSNEVGVFPVTEQQLRTYQKGGHPIALTGVVPVDAPADADYPYAVNRSAKQRNLVARLRAAITTEALVAAGFRAAPEPGASAPPAQVDQLMTAAMQWSQYKVMPFQVLLLIDSSGSMNDQVTTRTGQVTTKAGLLRESGMSANSLFGEETSIGMWFFGTPRPSSPAHVESVPVGPLTAEVDGVTRRNMMAKNIAGYQPSPNAGTPLFRTVLDGLATMRAKAKPGTATLVVVLTDGNDQGSRYAMPRDSFLEQLTAGQDPKRPVPVITVGYGADADMQALTSIAKATGGRAIAANNPADVTSAIAQAFLAAHAPQQG